MIFELGLSLEVTATGQASHLVSVKTGLREHEEQSCWHHLQLGQLSDCPPPLLLREEFSRPSKSSFLKTAGKLDLKLKIVSIANPIPGLNCSSTS